eukprot:PLAT3065.1.p1 GENE.PLAT3065.1~~PLAT3065.1.p1  ORF type:complete len:556 (+),score=235.79 PLAT3065.1:42-1709(+)
MAAERKEADSDAVIAAALAEEEGAAAAARLPAGGKKGKKAPAVQVFARFRPQSVDEEAKGGEDISEVDDNGTDCFISGPEGTRHAFRYAASFPAHTTQREVYERTSQRLVEAVLNGYNAAAIAYGQTGSGKTYTMLGPEFEDSGAPRLAARASPTSGIIPRLLEDVFHAMSLASAVEEFEVKVSFLEIYGDALFDLIYPRKDALRLRYDASIGSWSTDAAQVPVFDVEEAMQLMQEGLRRRKTAKTDMNARSSRSHAVYSLSIMRRDTSTGVIYFSDLYLVDLAGSERQTKTGTTGKRLDEAKDINRSLLALGNVIQELSKKRPGHISYRDSALTSLLQNCLGGNALTTLIVNVSPSSFNFKETLASLKFGDRASRIKNKPKARQEKSVREIKARLAAVNTEVHKQNYYLNRLRKQLVRYRELADIVMKETASDPIKYRTALEMFPMLRRVIDVPRHFLAIPVEMVEEVFDFLDGRTRGFLMPVCKEWLQLLDRDSSWQLICIREVGASAEPEDGKTWKTTYIDWRRKQHAAIRASEPAFGDRRPAGGALRLVAA